MDKKKTYKPKTPWQRLVLSITAVIIVAGMWRWSVFHLYSLPVEALTPFTSITNNAFYVIGSIVIFMISGKILFDMKNSTVSNIVQEATQITENLNKREDINIKEEYIQHIIEEGQDGAPEIRPFSQNATDEQ